MSNESQSIVREKWVKASLLLLPLLILGWCLYLYHLFNCIDGCGPYHNRASVADLAGDGDLNVVVATAKGASIWINQGGAQARQMAIFAESGQRLGRGHIETVFLGDFDANGALDALVAGKAQATIWWNDGGEGFRNSGQSLKYTERHGLAVGDFDGDGDLDVFQPRGRVPALAQSRWRTTTGTKWINFVSLMRPLRFG